MEIALESAGEEADAVNVLIGQPFLSATKMWTCDAGSACGPDIIWGR
jgi:hypothetical protein